MATFKFHLHRDQWYYQKRPGFDASKPVDIHALEEVFGVVGSRELIVILPAANKDEEYRVRINNGFIKQVHLAIKEEQGTDLQEIREFVAREMK